MATKQKHDAEDELNMTVDIAMERLDGLSRSLEDEEGPMDNFISDFLKRHRISSDTSPEDSSTAETYCTKSGQQSLEVPQKRLEAIPSAESSARSGQGMFAPPLEESDYSVVGTCPVRVRRSAKPSESQGDRMAMRQLANTIAKCVLESHGRVVLARNAMTLFVAAVGSIVAATALALAAPAIYSAMFTGALVWYVVAVYSTIHFWIISSRLVTGRAKKAAQ